jgi:hypothetical protein
MRTEFGAVRSECSCKQCSLYCHYMPGYLIPADLERMIPEDTDPFLWAESNLLASPGALVMRAGQVFSIPTLVPAVKSDGSCIHLNKDELCNIHEKAPFGCAFFSCCTYDEGADKLSMHGLAAIVNGGPTSLYSQLWRYLSESGRVQVRAQELRERVRLNGAYIGF